MARPTVIDENENESVQSAAGSDHQDAPETSQAAASRAEQSADQSTPTCKRRESRMDRGGTRCLQERCLIGATVFDASQAIR